MGPLIESHLVPFTQIDGLNFNRGTICFKWEGINTNYCTYRCGDICTRLTLSSHQVCLISLADVKRPGYRL
ncbi:hypothetical protein P3S68_011544 [Capsicum galapagoense]